MASAEDISAELDLVEHGLDRCGPRERVELLDRIVAIFDGFAGPTLQTRPALLRVLREQLLADASVVRAAALRALRHVLKRQCWQCLDEVLQQAAMLRMDYFVVSRLEAAVGVWERVCALRLIAHWLGLSAGSHTFDAMARVFISSLACIAGNSDDELHTAALRSLCDVSLSMPRLLAECQGFFCLAESLTEPTQAALAPSLVAALLHALDDPSARTYLSRRHSMHIRCLFAVYTGATSESTASLTREAKERRVARWDAARRAVLLLLRSATGLFALSSDPNGLMALCQLLRLPTEPALKWAVLELFGDVVREFCTRPLQWRSARATTAFSCRHCKVMPGGAGMMRRFPCSRTPSITLVDGGIDAGEATAPGTAFGFDGGGGLESRLQDPSSSTARQTQQPQQRRLEGANGGTDGSTTVLAAARERAAVSSLSAHFFHTSHDVDLLEVYASLVLRTLLACELPEALSEMCMNDRSGMGETPQSIATRGTALLAELNRAAAALLPVRACDVLQKSLNHVVNDAASFRDPCLRSRADELLAGLSSAAAAASSTAAMASAALHENSCHAWACSPTNEVHIRARRLGAESRQGDDRTRNGTRAKSSTLLSPRWSPNGQVAALAKPYQGTWLIGMGSAPSPACGSARRAQTASPRRPSESYLERARLHAVDRRITLQAAALDYVQSLSGEAAHERLLTHLDTLMGKPPLKGSVWSLSENDLHGQLKQSGVIGFSKDVAKWDWQLIHELINGLLHDPSRMTEVLGTKFFKRLIRFFVPRHGQGLFSFEWRPDHFHLAHLGRIVLGLMLTHPSARQQFLDAPESRFKGSSFPVELANMLSRELSDGQNIDNLAHTSSMFSPSVFSSSVFSPRMSMLPPPRNKTEESLGIPRHRSSSDPRDTHRRKQTRAKTTTDVNIRVPTPELDAEPSAVEDRSSSLSSSALAETASYPLNTSVDTPLNGSPSMGFLAFNPSPFERSTGSQQQQPFSRERIQTSLAREYFSYIGLLSSSSEGVAILSKSGVYQVIRSMCTVPAKDYLTCLVLAQLHYGFVENRALLEEAFHVGSPMLQLSVSRLLALMLGGGCAASSSPVGLVFDLNTRHGTVPRLGSVHPLRTLLSRRPLISRAPSAQSLMTRTQSSASVIALSSQGGRSRNDSFAQGSEREHSAYGPSTSPPGTPPRGESNENLMAGEASAAQVAATAAAVAAAAAAIAGAAGDGQEAELADAATQVSFRHASLCSSIHAAEGTPAPEGSDRWCWLISMFAITILHGDQRVSWTAVDALQEICRSEDAALALLAYWPSDPSLQARWPPILRLLLVQTEPGFEMMQRTGWLDHDSDLWYNHDHYKYVDLVSTMLHMAMVPGSCDATRHGFTKEEPVENRQVRSQSDPSDHVDAVPRSTIKGDNYITADPNSKSARVQIPRSWLSSDGSPQYIWLCSVPWRPLLQLSSSGGSEELLLDAVVERVVPHDIPSHFDHNQQVQSSLSCFSVFSEMRVTALCDVPLGADGNASLRACLGLGELLLEDTWSTFASADDWSQACPVEDLPDGGGVVYMFRQRPFGAVWTFLVGRRGMSDDTGDASSSAKRESKPPSNCRLVSVSWPLKAPHWFGEESGNNCAAGINGSNGVVPPPHFCSYLARTALGASFLWRTGYVQDRLYSVLTRVVDNSTCLREGQQNERAPPAPSAVEARAALWAVGHLGQLQYGLELLMETGTLALVVKITMCANRWSLRATALYCLALLAVNPLASEFLEELGWSPHTWEQHCEDGTHLPRAAGGGHHHQTARSDGSTGSSLAPWLGQAGISAEVASAEAASTDFATSDDDSDDSAVDAGPDGNLPAYAAFGEAHLEALAELESLHNTVVRKKACESLLEMRRQDASIFQSVPLWLRAQRRVARKSGQPLQVRRFIADLFEGALRSQESLRYLDSLAPCSKA